LRRLLSFAAALVALTVPIHAGTIHVPGDYGTIPEAVHYATADDTVIVGTGLYTIEPGSPFGWPVELDSDSPTIQSEDQVGKTVLQGDGTIPAFYVPGPPGALARVRITGFTIRSVSTPLLKEADCGASFHFTYNNIQDCGDGLDATSSDGLIAYNIIWNNGGNGIEVYHYFGVVEFNEIAYNSWGIRGTCCEEPTIRQNWIHRNSQGGIRTGFYAGIEDNVIHKNGGPGIANGASYGHITGNTITENVVGIEIWSVPDVLLRENGIYDNAPYDVVAWPSDEFNYDGTMNWWGTPEPELIAEHIWDCHDDPDIGVCIQFEPFCMSPGCEPTPVEPVSWGAIKAMFR
jgi:hypothetical protein